MLGEEFHLLEQSLLLLADMHDARHEMIKNALRRDNVRSYG